MVVEAGSHQCKGSRNAHPQRDNPIIGYLPVSASPGPHIDAHPGWRAVGLYWCGMPMVTPLALEEALLCSQRVPWDGRDPTSIHRREDGGCALGAS